MGARNLDRIPLHQRRHHAESVAQMAEQHWQVQAWCSDCRVKLKVDLRLVARVRGPGFSLWDKRGRCRAVGCTGAVDFYAQAPGRPGFSPLVSPRQDPADGREVIPAWIANRGPG